MAVFFTSDTHFGDHRVLNLYHRPFASVHEMDEAIIAAWNETVRSEDQVWHLGDFARTARRAEEIVARLNGRKHLILGNNDPPLEAGSGWESVASYAEIEVDGRKLVLCHYPFRSWNGMSKGALDLHGHSHGRLKALPRQFDVGVDAQGLRPVTLDQLLASGRARSARNTTG